MTKNMPYLTLMRMSIIIGINDKMVCMNVEYSYIAAKSIN